MSDLRVNPQHFVDTQADVLRLAKRDHGLSIARLSALSGIPENTLRSWSTGTSMPAWALIELARHIPADLINLLAEQGGFSLITTEHTDCVLDELACEASGFTHELLEARKDGVVTPIERARLKESARRVQALAAGVVA